MAGRNLSIGEQTKMNEQLMKKAKLRAIMDIMSQMDDMEMERLPKGMDDMEMEPEKKGLTIVKMEKSKPEIEIEEEPVDGMQETEETEKDLEPEEEYDESTSLGRLMKKLKKV